MSTSGEQSFVGEIRNALVNSLAELRPGQDFAAICLPLPHRLNFGEIIDASLDEVSLVWQSGNASATHDRLLEETEQIQYLGVGTAFRHRFVGDSRFSEAQAALQNSFTQIAASPETARLLRFFGGGAFQPGADGSGSCWEVYGDATFILPAVQILRSPEGDSCICAASTESLNEVVDLLTSVLRTGAKPSTQGETNLRVLSRAEGPTQAEWRHLMSNIQQEIASGEAEKIVAARRVTLELSGTPRMSTVLERLEASAPGCARFALRIGTRTFAAATPERLVAKRGRAVATEALAGTIKKTHDGAAHQLMGSQKDRSEHEFVVRAIVEALGGPCSEVSATPEPEIRRLNRMYHLRTPIRGTLREEQTHVLALVEALHPTPAVGGTPRRAAVTWIAKNEHGRRGWYASPFGWVGATGDGEFVVSLRSALFNKNKVHLFAGAGIVAGSDAQSEYDETELKLGGMLGALGVAG